MKKMPKIKNKEYRQFLDSGIIKVVETGHLCMAFDNSKGIRGKHKQEGKALLLVLYYSGAKPNEVLRMRSKDVRRDGNHIVFKIPKSKGTYDREVYVSYQRKYIKYLWEYTSSLFPNQLLFFNYIGDYIRHKGNQDNSIPDKKDISDRARYYIKKWFKGVFEDSISPYYLRHSFYSKLAQNGALMEELMLLKGVRSIDDVMSYKYKSKKIRSPKEMARMLK